MATGQVAREASAFLAIGAQLVCVPTGWAGTRARLVGGAADPEPSREIFLDVTGADAKEAAQGPAATGERGGA